MHCENFSSEKKQNPHINNNNLFVDVFQHWLKVTFVPDMTLDK